MLRGFDGELSRDLALYAYAGQQVADGVPPYVGVMNRSGPLAHLVPGAGAWVGDLVGVDDLLAIRVTAPGRLHAGRVGDLPPGPGRVRVPAGRRGRGPLRRHLPAFVLYAVGGPRDKTDDDAVPRRVAPRHGAHPWASAGVCLALATLTWQPAFLPGLATVAVAALLATAPRGAPCCGSWPPAR